MTYVLVALMILNGKMQEHMSIHSSRNECETAAQAAQATYPDATVRCLAIKGELA